MPDKVKPHENYKFPIHNVPKAHKQDPTPCSWVTLIGVFLAPLAVFIAVMVLVLLLVAGI
jgi:hypothetical protein